MIQRAYMISVGQYARYDAAADRVDAGYPKAMGAAWTGFGASGFAEGVDAAVNWSGGQVFFFKGGQHIRYHIEGNFVLGGYPASIAGRWPGMAEVGFAENLNAAVNFGDGNVFFFKGASYVRYDVAADRVVDGYPHPIASDWRGLGEAGFFDIDAVVNWGNGKLYFFKGDQYLRYDLATARADPDYPKSIDGGWPGLAAARGGRPIDAIWTRSDGDGAGLSDAFFVEVKAVASRLECDPVHLLGVMFSESGVQPWAQNPGGRATGLIQFMPSTLKTLGWGDDVEAFRGLAAEDQLPWVEKYYGPYRGRLDNPGRLYLATYLPASMGESDLDAALARRGERNYDQNAGLDMNQDGEISINDLSARVASLQTGARWQALVGRL